MKNKRHSALNIPQSLPDYRRLEQLSLFPVPSKHSSQYLSIEPVPTKKRVTPNIERYYLTLKPSGVRIAPIQLFAHEADLVAASTKGWEWRLNESGRLEGAIAHQLESLLIEIIEGEAA